MALNYNVKFVKGTASRYNELVAAGSIDNLTFYYLTDSADLYLGSVLLSNEPEVSNAIERIIVLEGLVGQEKADGKDATGIFAELESIKAELGALTGTEGGVADMISDAITALEEKLAPSLAQIEANKTAIATEKGRAEGAEKELSDALKAHKDAMDKYHEGIDQAIADLVAADLTINGAIGTVGERVTVVETALNGVPAGEGTEKVKGLIERVGDVEGVASTNSGAITTLIGGDSDKGKSVRTIANEELAAQLLSGKADADFKTLQDLAAWLEDHPEDAAAMNAQIDKNKSDIESILGKPADENGEGAVTGLLDSKFNAAKSYTDEKVGELNTALTKDGGVIDTKVAAGVQAAKSHAETKATEAKDAAIEAANGYTDGEIEKLTTVTTGVIDTRISTAISTALQSYKTSAEVEKDLNDAIALLKTTYKLDTLGTAAYANVADLNKYADDAAAAVKGYVDTALSWAEM